MLPTTPEFDAAVDNDTTEVTARVRIYREFNAIARNISIDSVHDALDPRFGVENVTRTKNPEFNGIAYGPPNELFTSSNPVQGFRAILSQDFDPTASTRYFIPKDSSNSTLADFTIDYSEPYQMNAVNIRYENSRTSTTFYDDTIEVYAAAGTGTPVLIWSGTMNTDGNTMLYFDGTDWDEGISRLGSATTAIRKLRFRFVKATYDHNPRVMYAGGLNIVDASEDIIRVSVNKTEFEQSTYLPIGDPSGNTCDIELDNTAMTYRFGPDADKDYFLRNQKVTVEFGVNIKYGGGADTYEYVPGGTFYVDDYGYNEEEMTVSISGQDRSKLLQEIFCGNYLWVNKSLKYIVHDVLARSGISPKQVVFDFGIAANDNENNKRKYTWSDDEQTLWDFLSGLAKSELGTVYYDEEENLVFTDRNAIDGKFNEGSQYIITADTNLESLEEKFEIGANKVKVKYEELGLNTSKFNPQLVLDKNGNPAYQSGPEVMLNQVLWEPGEGEDYVGSAVLSRTLTPTATYMYISKDSALQITRDEGEVLLGDEFITYKDRTLLNNGELRLRIVNRDNRNTVYAGQIPVHEGINSPINMARDQRLDRRVLTSSTYGSRSMTPTGFRQRLWSGTTKYRGAWNLTRFKKSDMNYGTGYRIYGMRFRFNELPSRFKSQQAAGMYIGMNSAGKAIYFEITKEGTTAAVRTGGQGNVRAYKMGREGENRVPLPRGGDSVDKVFLFDEATLGQTGGNEGTYIDITVTVTPRSGADLVSWFVNGEYIDSFFTYYPQSAYSGYTKNQRIVAASNCDKGHFGMFTRGSTDVTVDFMYASNLTSLGPDEVLQSRGFFKYFDTARQSWNIKNNYYIKGKEYYIEFGTPVHEVLDLEVDHETFPAAFSALYNSDMENISVFKQSSNPFNSKLLVANTSRLGVRLNDTVYYPNGQTLDHRFFIYGVPIITGETDEIETEDGPSIRRYGVNAVELENPWINSKAQAVSLASHVRKFWSKPAQFFDASIFPNPAIQPRDRVGLLYNEKGFDGTDVWFVVGMNIEYDGGLTSTLLLKRYEDYPTQNLDYRDDGGIVIT